MGGHYDGDLAFADDTTLLSPSMTGLRKMSSICEQYASDMIFCLMEVKVSYCFSKAVVVMYSLLVLLYVVS